MNTQYDYDYFINKFSAIPDERWCEGALTDHRNRHCVFGHCGLDSLLSATEEAGALQKLGRAYGLSFMAINDGYTGNGSFHQNTPKQRVLAALRHLKARAEAALDAYERRELKPLSPVLQEQVIATDGPVSCEYLAGSSVAGRQA